MMKSMMDIRPLLLKLNPYGIYAPQSICLLATTIGFKCGAPSLLEKLARKAVYLKEPDGQIISGGQSVNAWLGWKWIQLSITHEFLWFNRLFSKLDQVTHYSPSDIANFGTDLGYLASIDETTRERVISELYALASSSRQDVEHCGFWWRAASDTHLAKILMMAMIQAEVA